MERCIGKKLGSTDFKKGRLLGRRKWGWQDRWHCYNSDLMPGYQGRRDASSHSESWRRSGSGRRQREAVKITHLCPGNGERQGEGSVPGQASLRTTMEPAQEPETLCGVHTEVSGMRSVDHTLSELLGLLNKRWHRSSDEIMETAGGRHVHGLPEGRKLRRWTFPCSREYAGLEGLNQTGRDCL